ncbi:hypothetical protein ACIBG7_05780 [Nonomuraea sp. NPDC050328]
MAAPEEHTGATAAAVVRELGAPTTAYGRSPAPRLSGRTAWHQPAT